MKTVVSNRELTAVNSQFETHMQMAKVKMVPVQGLEPRTTRI